MEEGYKLLNFIFIVVETKISSSHPAIIYRVSDIDLLAGIYGGKEGRKTYKGIDELIDAYKFHRDNNYWELPRDLHFSRGEIELKVFDKHELQCWLDSPGNGAT